MNRFVLLMGVALVAGCYNNNNPGQLICQANRIIQQRPDSALILLKQIDSSGRWNRRLRAEYSLAYVTALDKNYIDTTNVSLLNPAIDYYERRGTAEDKMKVYYYLGCLQSNEGDFTSACASFNRAWREARMTDDPLAKGMIMAALGIAYNANMIAEEELYCFQQAYSWFSEAGDSAYIDNSRYLLAKAYHNNHLFSEADSLYALVDSHDRLAAAALLGRAVNAIKVPAPDPGPALNFFEEAMNQGARLGLDEWYQYVYALYLSGQTDKAERMMGKLAGRPDDVKSYWWKYIIAEYKKDFASALNNLQDYAISNDSLVRRLLQQSLYKVERNQYMYEAELARRDKDKARAGMALMALLVLLTLSIATLFQYRMKNRFRRRSTLLEQQFAEAQHMAELLRVTSEAEIRTTEEKLLSLRSSFASMYQRQFSTIGQLYNTNLDLSVLYDKEQKEYAHRVRVILSEIGDSPEQQKQFESRINRDIDDIMSKLRYDFPGFSEESFRILSYCIVGFRSSTIASIMSLDSGTVRTRKSRLKNKILSANSPNHELYATFLQ